MRNLFSLNYSISNWPHHLNYRLAPLEKTDWEPIRLWRNSQLSILRQNHPLSLQEQENYWQKQSSLSPTQSHLFCFSYKENEKSLGYGGFVHIDFETASAELSSLLDPSFSEPSPLFLKISEVFLRLSLELAHQLGLKKLTAEAYDHRLDFISLLYKLGFQCTGYLPERKLYNGINYGSWCFEINTLK